MTEERSARWTWHESEEIIVKLVQIEHAIERGKSASEAAKAAGISYGTYRRWKKSYGGMSLHQLRWTRKLELENNRMRQLIAAFDAPLHVSLSGLRKN